LQPGMVLVGRQPTPNVNNKGAEAEKMGEAVDGNGSENPR
jgi:hypothetical protein